MAASRRACRTAPRASAEQTDSPEQRVRTALLLAVIVPPLGALRADRLLRAREEKSRITGAKPGLLLPRRTTLRRRARAALALGVLLSVSVSVLAMTLWAKHDERARIDALNEQKAVARAQLAEDIKGSKSLGTVDEAMCLEVDGVITSSPSTLVITDASEITSELLAHYDTLAQTASVYGPTYAEYAAHLRTFDAQDDTEHQRTASAVSWALNDDALSCIDLRGGPEAVPGLMENEGN